MLRCSADVEGRSGHAGKINPPPPSVCLALRRVRTVGMTGYWSSEVRNATCPGFRKPDSNLSLIRFNHETGGASWLSGNAYNKEAIQMLFQSNEEGQGLVEYALILLLVATVVMGKEREIRETLWAVSSSGAS